MRVHSLVLWGMVAAVAGCGDDVTINDGSTPDLSMGDLAGTVDMTIPDDLQVNVSATQFVMDEAAATCAHLMMCGQLSAANMAACIEANTAQIGVDEDTEIAKGRIHINELQCLAAIMGARCDGEDSGGVFLGKCLRLLDKPMQPSDGTSQCLFSGECVKGYCAHGSSDAGVCTAFKGLTAACTSDVECDSTMAFCDPGTHQCAALAGVSADCSVISCLPNLYCDSNSKCAAPTPSGTTGVVCNPFQGISTDVPACAAGFFCKVTATPSPVCTAKIPMGSNCNPNDAYQSGIDNQCADGSSCYQTVGQANASCQAWAGVSQPCDPANNSCQATLYCDNVTNPAAPVCKALIADNQPCNASTNNHCLAGSAHSGQNCIGSVCVPDKPYNGTCNPATDDPVCDTGYCSPTNNRCSVLCM
jgi:hypothetical protein